MNDFWSRKLAATSRAQRPAPAPQPSAPASSRPWWDQSAPVEVQQGYGAPAGAQVLYDAQGNAVLVGPNGQIMAAQGQPGDLPPEVIAHHTKSARLAKSTARCPECDSPNYTVTATAFTKNGQVETKKCFDCGYPVKQEFSGMANITSGEAAGKARQVEHGGKTNNFAGQQTQAPAFAAKHGGPGR